MVQGNQKLRNKSSSRVTKKQKNPKKAAPKIVKPKKAVAKRAQKLSRAQQGQLMSATEKQIAGRVGHLELIKGSRREIEKGSDSKNDK